MCVNSIFIFMEIENQIVNGKLLKNLNTNSLRVDMIIE